MNEVTDEQIDAVFMNHAVPAEFTNKGVTTLIAYKEAFRRIARNILTLQRPIECTTCGAEVVGVAPQQPQECPFTSWDAPVGYSSREASCWSRGCEHGWNAALSQGKRPNEWKQAIDDELVTIESTADSFPTAKEALKALIDWHVAVALDPAVSSAAQALIDQGMRQAEPVAPSAPTVEHLRALAEAAERAGAVSMTVHPTDLLRILGEQPVALSTLTDEVGLIKSVLRGYPKSMAREDAVRAVEIIERALAASAPALQAGQGEAPSLGGVAEFGFSLGGTKWQYTSPSHERAAPAPELDHRSALEGHVGMSQARHTGVEYQHLVEAARKREE